MVWPPYGENGAPFEEWQQLHPPEIGPIPGNAYKKNKKPGLWAWARQGLINAVTMEDGKGRRLSIMKASCVCLAAILLVLGLSKTVGLITDMQRNEARMKAVRQQYQDQAGAQLDHRASRVELLPPGVTFSPGEAPLENAGTTALEADQPVQEGTAEPAQAQDQRTKARNYLKNPMGNIRPEFEDMRKENRDISGRLVIEGVMDEVVVQRNNTYYLTRNIRGGFSASGTIFMDEACNIVIPPENLLLRGQSVAENQAFGSLTNYGRGGADYVRANALVQLTTLYEEEQYVVFAVILAGNNPQSANYFNYAGYPVFQSDWEMEKHVTTAKAHSLYEIPVDVQPSDRLLTLSTVNEGVANIVVMARMLRPEETPQSLSGALGGIRAR